tara:strand:+ start:942 stop:1535 length:594 start_codon:yes stop_codon:yes gene_type:complete
LKSSKEIMIATSNVGKVKEFNNLFKGYKILSLKDLDIEDPIENGTSFLENALIKAKHGAMLSKKFTIADDSGLVVPKLNFEPGIYSARYAGERATDKDNRDKIINKLNELGLKEMDAYYVCVLVGIRSYGDPMPIVTQGEIHGKVSFEDSGDGGFGYDKIFYPSSHECSMASIDPSIKNQISHRSIAVNKFFKIYNS